MYCEWEPYKDGKYRCKNPNCRRITRDPKCLSDCTPRPVEERLSDEQAEAAFTILGYSIFQIRRWKKEVVQWCLAGCPVRSNEEVYTILTICRSNLCGVFDAKKGQCGECGCRLNDSQFAVFNAARMGSKHCPRGLW